MKRYKLTIRTPGKMIFFKNRLARTPVVLNNVSQKELDLLIIKINSDAIEDYDIEDYDIEDYDIEDYDNFNSIETPKSISEEIVVNSNEEEIDKSSIINKLLTNEYTEFDEWKK